VPARDHLQDYGSKIIAIGMGEHQRKPIKAKDQCEKNGVVTKIIQKPKSNTFMHETTEILRRVCQNPVDPAV